MTYPPSGVPTPDGQPQPRPIFAPVNPQQPQSPQQPPQQPPAQQPSYPDPRTQPQQPGYPAQPTVAPTQPQQPQPVQPQPAQPVPPTVAPVQQPAQPQEPQPAQPQQPPTTVPASAAPTPQPPEYPTTPGAPGIPGTPNMGAPVAGPPMSPGAPVPPTRPMPSDDEPSSTSHRVLVILASILGFLALAAGGAAAMYFLGSDPVATAARADVAAIGREVAAQYDAGGTPVVALTDGGYAVSSVVIGAASDDPSGVSIDFYPGAGSFCVVLTAENGTEYSFSAADGATDGSCAPAGVEPLRATPGSVDSSLAESEYWFGLAVGDCVVDDSIVTESASTAPAPLSAPSVVACSEPHAGEVYAVARISRDEAPDDAAFRADVRLVCEGAPFEAYVGIPYRDSELYYSVLYPSADAWQAGADEMVCLLANGSTTTGSLEGAAR